MNGAPDFITQEFVPELIYKTYGEKSVWFIDPRIPVYAQFLKEFFLQYYQIKYAAQVKTVKKVIIRINNWHTGGDKQWRGFRPPECLEGVKLSQHRFGRAIDTDIIIVFSDGTSIEADYKEVQKVILDNQSTFLKYGVTAIEDISIASTWLHSDMRWNNNSTDILIVKP